MHFCYALPLIGFHMQQKYTTHDLLAPTSMSFFNTIHCLVLQLLHPAIFSPQFQCPQYSFKLSISNFRNTTLSTLPFTEYYTILCSTMTNFITLYSLSFRYHNLALPSINFQFRGIKMLWYTVFTMTKLQLQLQLQNVLLEVLNKELV